MQIGAGDFDPDGATYHGSPAALDGPQSCSVVCDPKRVVLPSGQELAAEAFWADEFAGGRKLPDRLEDLVIYELHVGALGFGKAAPGTLDDAIAFVEHLSALGVNAVELLPIAEFETRANWGYGTSHFFAADQGAGGTDRLKMFVKVCHQRGIVVILDVCYNHFDPDGERAQWAYDSNDHTRNIYYWYEGNPGDYADPRGGYIDNISTGWAPRFDEEAVRQLFHLERCIPRLRLSHRWFPAGSDEFDPSISGPPCRRPARRSGCRLRGQVSQAVDPHDAADQATAFPDG
ncbi:hypothetical protein LZK76_12495 [Rhizobium leguminosarum]|nr:hypothetical protein LZK76_12495 [Rhizobium leguminosarum]